MPNFAPIDTYCSEVDQTIRFGDSTKEAVIRSSIHWSGVSKESHQIRKETVRRVGEGCPDSDALLKNCVTP